jgi:hypothetical protein
MKYDCTHEMCCSRGHDHQGKPSSRKKDEYISKCWQLPEKRIGYKQQNGAVNQALAVAFPDD